MQDQESTPRQGKPFGTRNEYECEDHRQAVEKPDEKRVVEFKKGKIMMTNYQYWFLWRKMTTEMKKAQMNNVHKKGVRKTHVVVGGKKFLTNRVGKPQFFNGPAANPKAN